MIRDLVIKVAVTVGIFNMSCDIISGRLKPCDTKAGIETVYLGRWTKNIDYTYSGNTLLSLNADYYEFETINASYTTKLSHTDEGEAYEINVKFDLPKVTKTISRLVNKLSDLNVFAILKTYNGQYIYLGLENGLNPKLSETSGGAKNSFNGYSIELSGTQTQIPPLQTVFTSIDNNLFILLPNGATVRYLGTQSGDTGTINGVEYTAISQSDWNSLDPITTDWSTKCTTLVTDMNMKFFSVLTFNSSIIHFDTRSVTNMSLMFSASNFNQNIGVWNTSNVVNFSAMFGGATDFNQPIGLWDTSSATDMTAMFNSATVFNQNLSGWCVELIATEPPAFAIGSELENNPNFLPNWGDPC